MRKFSRRRHQGRHQKADSMVLFMFLCGARDFRKCPRSLAVGQQPAAALYSKGLFQSTEFGRSPPFMVFLLCPIRTQTNTNLMQ